MTQRGNATTATAAATAIAETQAWLELAVIGLELCPFARAVHVKQQIRYVVSDSDEPEGLLELLCAEMHHLVEADPARTETTLLIHPRVLTDFGDYNEFLDVADAALEALGYDGVLQVASFHPQYRYADTDADDVTNATNRSPYPMLHLLREDSVERAVAAFPEAETIFERNIETMEALGAEGWAALVARCRRPVA